MTFGLVDVGYSLPEGQAVKLIFFARCHILYMFDDKDFALLHYYKLLVKLFPSNLICFI